MEDEEIIALYFARNTEAIKYTSDKYAGRLKALAERPLGSKEDAEECVNDTLFNAWNSIPPNKPDFLSAYLSKICRNLALNRIDWNTAKKRNAVVVELTEEMEKCIPDYNPQLFRNLFEDEVNFIGYPVASGSGSVVSFGNELYAVSSSSDYKDAAWQFIRQYITEEYQNTVYSFPINKEVFENRIAEEMVKDTSNIGVSYNNFSIELEPLSETDAECIRKLVYGATRSASYDNEVMNIILEEAKKYYSGEKSADETAHIIQSRVSVYVEEKR